MSTSHKQRQRPDRLTATDHAVLRWLERKHGITRQEILSEMFGDNSPKTLPNGVFRFGEHWFVVEGNCILTVLTNDERKHRARTRSKGRGQ